MADPAPFLRWAGGKRRLLPAILAGAPATFGAYFEPFIGGGAVLFALRLAGDRVTINDVNPDLLAVYRALRDDPETLIDGLAAHATAVSADDFYAMRASTPANDMERAVRMVYLNRTCFNGLYRVNANGEFNVPYGKLRHPVVCNAELLRACAAALDGVRIREGSFADAVADADAGDFVYFDPPYIPLSPTASFSRYARDDFTQPDQERLAAIVTELTGRGVHVMLSNSDTPLTRDIFAGLDLHSVSVARSISASAGSRTRVREVIGVNYPTSAMRDPDTFTDLVVSG